MASFLPTGIVALPTTSGAISVASPWEPSSGSQQHHTAEILDRYQRLRKVSYSTSNGVVIIDDDVVYGTEEEFSDAVEAAKQVRTNPGLGSHGQRRALSWVPVTNAWPGAEVLFAYENEAAKSAAGDVLRQGMEVWKGKAPFLKFTEESYREKGKLGVLVIMAKEC